MRVVEDGKEVGGRRLNGRCGSKEGGGRSRALYLYCGVVVSYSVWLRIRCLTEWVRENLKFSKGRRG